MLGTVLLFNQVQGRLEKDLKEGGLSLLIIQSIREILAAAIEAKTTLGGVGGAGAAVV